MTGAFAVGAKSSRKQSSCLRLGPLLSALRPQSNPSPLKLIVGTHLPSHDVIKNSTTWRLSHARSHHTPPGAPSFLTTLPPPGPHPPQYSSPRSSQRRSGTDTTVASADHGRRPRARPRPRVGGLQHLRGVHDRGTRRRGTGHRPTRTPMPSPRVPCSAASGCCW